MKKYAKETTVGIFVFLGLVSMAYMSVKLGNINLFSKDHYLLRAQFTDVSGLKTNAPVSIYGVEMGYVGDIRINLENGLADVDLFIRKDITLLDDTIASVKTSGLIGDRYVKITPGGIGEELKPGEKIFDTEPAIDIEDLISKYVFGGV